MDVDQPWLKHGVISERGAVCRELTICLAMPYPGLEFGQFEGKASWP